LANGLVRFKLQIYVKTELVLWTAYNLVAKRRRLYCGIETEKPTHRYRSLPIVNRIRDVMPNAQIGLLNKQSIIIKLDPALNFRQQGVPDCPFGLARRKKTFAEYSVKSLMSQRSMTLRLAAAEADERHSLFSQKRRAAQARYLFINFDYSYPTSPLCGIVYG